MEIEEKSDVTSINDLTRRIIMHHLSSFQDNNLEAVVADYTKDSFLITQDETFKGPKEIKRFFAGLMPHFPKSSSEFMLDKLVVVEDFAYIVWHANTPSLHVPLGSDTFVVKNGKILQQSFVGKLNFIK